MGRRSGIVVRISPERDRARASLGFLPTERVEAIVRMPRVSPVAGARLPLLGVAPVMGAVIPVVTLGGDTRPQSAAPGARDRGMTSLRTLVVCLLAGEKLGIAGVEVVAVGHFDIDGAGVRVDGEQVLEVDLASVSAELHSRPWAGRVGA